MARRIAVKQEEERGLLGDEVHRSGVTSPIRGELPKGTWNRDIEYLARSMKNRGIRLIGCGWESLMKSVTLGNVTMSHRRERPAECLASLSHSTMIGLPRAARE
ncbi:hypothetical protein EVAR_102223_1 [Eumeta japonica]|uniref:Uncharacterized protein n=1 Tax=Eumeta variegata TaxID=151549 RepID=A0A4C1WEH7_EUMVA|nr:hypothetical protein EVAR_102223_1 [Eumeta japonica]